MTDSAIESAMLLKLRETAALRDLAGDKIFPGKAPQDVLPPFVVYSLVSDVQDMTMDGPSGLAKAMLRYDCIADTYSAAKAMSAAIRALSGFRGTLGGVRIDALFWTDAADQTDPPVHGDDVAVNRVPALLTTWYYIAPVG